MPINYQLSIINYGSIFIILYELNVSLIKFESLFIYLLGLNFFIYEQLINYDKICLFIEIKLLFYMIKFVC